MGNDESNSVEPPVINLAVNYAEFQTIARNGELVEAALTEVRRIRAEKSLAV